MNSSIPSSGFKGFKENFKSDALSGFLVFLIALPLCLAISKASGFPPVAGILTAIIGGMVVSFLGGSELTIKGPAAGLIVIAVGAVDELGKGDPMVGYKLTLAVVVIAGIIQVLFGLLRSGVLGDFFPSAAIHGMMAAIGITIIIKQLFILTGVKAVSKNTLELTKEIPGAISNMNPEVFIIGLVSLLILFLFPLIKNKNIKKIPAQLLVIVIAIPLGHYFDLEHEHLYLFLDHHNYTIGPSFLVQLPKDLSSAITFPDFSQVTSAVSIKYIIMFALVGSLESLLSGKAIDMIDPYKRKSNLNKDLVGVGIGNTLAGLVGGLPMISEIVRSSANVSNGAKTKWANFYHGLFLLLFVAFAGTLITQIPSAALAAMLIYTGFRLASPKEFAHTLHKGAEQLAIFIITIIVTLATDLLLGIAAGIITKIVIHLINGLPLKSVFKPVIEILHMEDTDVYRVDVFNAAVFSNFIGLKKRLDAIPKGKDVTVDLSAARLVDHTVMEHLHHYENDYISSGGKFSIIGLDNHKPISGHPLAARKLAKG
jgi:MFS superfamily sulfate permease-like transporter